jgi:chemotaxis protein MotB
MDLGFRRERTSHVSRDRWLVSYADFVTLLFAFFVVLYASAQVDRQRALQVSDAIRSGFQQLGVFQDKKADAAGNPRACDSRRSIAAAERPSLEYGNNSKVELATVNNELQEVLATQIARNEASLLLKSNELVVSLREIGFFDSGSAKMKAGTEKVFAQVAEILRAHSCTLRVEGHTDNVPIHTSQFASNWELSTARASSIVQSLVNTYGIPPELLSAAGYAEFHPASDNSTDQGRALNRRVDLVILSSKPRPALTNRLASLPSSNNASLANR